jgi:hypothetical protein
MVYTMKFFQHLVLLLLCAPTAWSAITITHSTAAKQYLAGDRFVLETRVSGLNGQELGGFDLTLAYDTARFSLGTTTLTSFLGDPHIPLMLAIITDDVGSRRVRAVSLQPASVLGASQGSGGLLFLTEMVAITSGTANQQFSVTGQLAAGDGSALPVSSITVELTSASPIPTLGWPALLMLMLLLYAGVSRFLRRVGP